MKCLATPPHLRLLAVTACLIGLSGLRAQETFTFSPYTRSGCQPRQTVTTTTEMGWVSHDACLYVELDPDGQTLRLGPAGTLAGALVYGGETSTGAITLTAPADSSRTYGLSVWVEDTLGARIPLEGDMTLRYMEGVNREFLLLTLSGSETACAGTVEAGSTWTVARFKFTNILRDGQGFRFRYAWSDFETGTVISEIVVPESDFDGAGYVHELLDGPLSLESQSGVVFVNTAAMKPVPQDIRLVKTGGSLVTTRYTTLSPGSAANGEPHRVTLAVTDATVCLSKGGEVVLETGVVLSMTRTQVLYDHKYSCLGLAGGTLVVPTGGSLALGHNGIGMQLFQGGTTRVEADAALELNGVISVGQSPGRISVAPGATVTVGAQSSLLFWEGQQKIRVELAPGASFDASAAPRDVQDVFQVVSTSSTPELLPASRFAAYPNPAPAGEATVTLASRGALAHAIVRVDLLDAVGRLVRADRLSGQATDFRHTLALPSAGVYTARLTDASGAVGHLRLVGQ